MDDIIKDIVILLATVFSVIITIVKVTGNAQKEANDRHIKLIEAIGELKNNKVSHEVCATRQGNCPCYSEIKHIISDIKELKKEK